MSITHQSNTKMHARTLALLVIVIVAIVAVIGMEKYSKMRLTTSLQTNAPYLALRILGMYYLTCRFSLVAGMA